MNLQIIEIFNPIGSMYPIPTLYQFCQSEKSFNFRVEPGANHEMSTKHIHPRNKDADKAV